MKPPRLKVALYWGCRDLKLSSSTPVQIVSDQNSIALPAGELNLRLGPTTPAAQRRWLWIGNVQEETLAQTMRQVLESSGLTTCLWSVGLQPTGSEWGNRSYRILVQPEDPNLSFEGLIHRLRELQPTLKPVELDFPEGKASGSLILQDAENNSHQLTLPIHLETEGSFAALAAPIGEGFHWEHTETLGLPSPIWIAVEAEGKLCAGIELEIEDYLASVNSSEMPAESPLEFLKAQVVAARSWLFANWGSHHPGEPYTVCNGDHCQCFYGENRIAENSRLAAETTRGEMLLYNDLICDARYAKSCGGSTEPGSNVWSFVEEPYLEHRRDLPESEAIDFSKEKDFREFQQRQESREACCSPGYAALEGKLKELAGFYRWTISSTRSELREIIRLKTGVDVGVLEEIRPLKRGPSGRLVELEARGDLGYLLLTPELAIRRALAKTHLPSSAFWIEYPDPERVVFHGAGWGHGVGMCQIGAAALASQGYTYRQVLKHYYPNTDLKKIY